MKSIPGDTVFYVFDTSYERIKGCKYNLKKLLGVTPIINFVNINNLHELNSVLDAIKKTSGIIKKEQLTYYWL